MVDPYFSIVCPTRGRLNMLRTTVRSLVETAHDLGSFELFLVGDRDDHETGAVAAELMSKYRSALIYYISRNRSHNLSRDYYNWVFFNQAPVQPRGHVFWIIGNDIVMKTPDWDRIAQADINYYLAGHADRVLYAHPTDTSKNKPTIGFDWGWFPMLTREAAYALGFFMPDAFPSWGADTVLARIFHNVGRILKLPINIDHLSYHAYNVRKDEIGRSMEATFVQYKQVMEDYRTRVLPRDIKRLGAHIERVEQSITV